MSFLSMSVSVGMSAVPIIDHVYIVVGVEWVVVIA